MRNLDYMNDFELSERISKLESEKMKKTKELIEINKEFRDINDELQMAISIRNNRHIDKRFKQLNLGGN